MSENTRMRFRTDHRYVAEATAKGQSRVQKMINSDSMFEWCSQEEWDATPPAEPGDTWRIRWHRPGEELGPIAGYDICCPRCKHVHGWTSARNCGSRRSHRGEDGLVYTKCDHSGVSSCWSWTGSAENNELTASPSLHCDASLGGCGWHGWLQNGVLRA